MKAANRINAWLIASCARRLVWMFKFTSSEPPETTTPCIDVGLLLDPENLEPRRCAEICVDNDGYIVEKGRCNELVALPAFYNSHIHILDYMLAGIAVSVDPEKLLAWPHGVKASSIAADPDAAFAAAAEYMRRLVRLGWGGVTIFVEGGGSLCRIVSLLASHVGLAIRTFGRGRVDELDGCDGLGVPSFESRVWMREALYAKGRGIPVAAHISETRVQALLDDYSIALYLRLHHAVHLLYAPPEAHRVLVEHGVALVYSPVSNSILWGDVPYVLEDEDKILLGSDNAGWNPPSPWTLATTAIMLLRRRVGLRKAIEIIAKALTINAWRVFGFSRPPLLLLHAPQVVRSVEPLAALLLTGGADQVVGLYPSLKPIARPTAKEPAKGSDASA